MFIFAVIGMQLFSTTYTVEAFDGQPNFTPFPGFEGVPEWNWNDFLHSFVMVFRVLCRETYQPMFNCKTANSWSICIPFYLAILFIGSYVVLNLFLAVLLNAFSGDDLKKKNEDDEESRLAQRFRNVKRWFKRKFRKMRKKSVEPADESRENDREGKKFY